MEVYARELQPISLKHTLPTIISGPPIGEGDADDLPADVLPVWPERGVRRAWKRMPLTRCWRR
jgi:hypothetical protein